MKYTQSMINELIHDFTITESDFSYCDLSNLDLAGLKIVNSHFVCAKLKDIDFSHSILINANFNGAHIENTQFEGTNLECGLFKHAVLKNAIFDKANLAGANFRHSDLQNIDLRIASNISNIKMDRRYYRSLWHAESTL